MTEQTNTQVAPWPAELAALIGELTYREGWEFHLYDDYDRGQGSRGLTLIITVTTPNSYQLDQTIRVAHLFPIPPAAYDTRSWRRWLFERIGDVETHERCEFFLLRDDSTYDPEDECALCGHQATQHDGRQSLCLECADMAAGWTPEPEHRFQAAVPRYTRPYAPSHGPGNDPYLVRELGTDIDRRTSFRGELNPE